MNDTNRALADGLRRLADLVDVADVDMKLSVLAHGNYTYDKKAPLRVALLAHYASSFDVTPTTSANKQAVAKFEGLEVDVYGDAEVFGRATPKLQTINEFTPYTVAELVERAEPAETGADIAAVGF